MKIDPNILQQLAPTFGVEPLKKHPPLVALVNGKAALQAEGEIAEVLSEAGYSFSFNDQGYHNESQYADDDQAVYILNPNGGMVWVWAGEFVRGFNEPTKLRKWLIGDEKYPEGKGKTFIETYSKAVGAGPKIPKNRMATGGEEIPYEPPTGPVPDRSAVAPANSEVDKIISIAKKKAGIGRRLPADDIIDLYKKAKELGGAEREKLISFIKTLKSSTDTKPLNERHIKKSSLAKLIKEIVKGILKSGHINEESGTCAAGPVSGPTDIVKRWTVKEKVKDDEQLDEMTTTSGGGGSSAGSPGYNIPGAFTMQMKGKDHIEVLGYKMTPAGEKEYSRKGDRLLEGKVACKLGIHKWGPERTSSAMFFNGQMQTSPVDYQKCVNCGKIKIINNHQR
jgi:hypothetical protein